MTVRERLRTFASQVRTVATRGPDHRRRLSDIDTRIVVSGTRGKSGTTRRLHDIFADRGSRVTMYENAREIRRHTPEDVLIVENRRLRSTPTGW